ncbi:right-handed parallel beta-helix repeat-containing protein [Dyadobacter sp. 3J3]|uniref:right-handed parallel beta-helix repeat-containing protein n=1 Tax=Dyadobacter sp. 3J3 TaxID=2606600 RepID=UPI00135C368E|nr:right-handed parallel beta-helix repeat-containing protein [Dyadobacter sp. 3J3]
MKIIISIGILCCACLQGIAANFYVAASGNNSNTGASIKSPFLTIQKAADLATAGDTVFVMNGTYKSVSGPLLNITKSGKADKYIVFKSYPGHTPKLTASGNVWNTVAINGSYILFEGFEMEGNNANLTYEGAMAVYNEHLNGGKNYSGYAAFNTNAITIGGPKAESKFPHHIVVRNCIVHDFPGGGISAIQTDYVTIENNVVFNNAWYMMYAGSGISILTPFNSDQVTGYKNIIRNNIVSGNKTTVPWIQLKRLSDGNGIIIDVNQHAYNNQDSPAATAKEAYTGRTLVENNVSFNNGGSGIHSFKADHVDIINNTAYHNGTVMNYPDIFTNQCQDVNIINNIMYARDGGLCNSKPKNTTEVYANNVYFNGQVGHKGENDIEADPQFVKPSTDHNLADFKLKKSSPAVNHGSGVKGFFSVKDILGTVRPKETAPDCGAYEQTF